MAGAKRKFDATVKVYSVGGVKIQTQGSRQFGFKAIYLMMEKDERAQARQMLDTIDQEGGKNG